MEYRRLVYERVEANNIQDNFNKSYKLAGHDWLTGFLTRKPSDIFQKPNATSVNQISTFNVNEVQLFSSLTFLL